MAVAEKERVKNHAERSVRRKQKRDVEKRKRKEEEEEKEQEAEKVVGALVKKRDGMI